MLAAAGIRLEENREVLPEYFVYRVVMPPQTLFRGVLDLPPGSGLEVTVDRAGCRTSAVRGYDPLYGARPLRRLIQQAIGDQLAKKLLAGEVHDGDTVAVNASKDGEGLVLG